MTVTKKSYVGGIWNRGFESQIEKNIYGSSFRPNPGTIGMDEIDFKTYNSAMDSCHRGP